MSWTPFLISSRKLQQSAPLLSRPQQEDGSLHDQEKYREASFDGADGVVVKIKQKCF